MNSVARPRRARLVLPAAAVILSLVVTACAQSGDGEPGPTEDETITVGALLDLSDGWTTLGRDSETTLRLAAEDANAFLGNQGLDTRVELVVADVAGDPAATEDELLRLQGEGVRIFIGPQASSEVAAVLDTANDDGSVLISQGSTASALAESGDNLFRFVPDDIQEARAVIAQLGADRIASLVPVWRDDLGNDGLHDSVTSAFANVGGEVADGVRYAADTTEFADVVDELSEQVSAAVESQGSERTGVYLAGFDEVADLFDAAQGDAALSSVRWYGSDGVALSDALVENQDAAAYANGVGYPNPLLGLDPETKRAARGFISRATRVDGDPPDAFAIAAYDAFQVAVRAWVSADGIDDVDRFKRNFALIADSYDGLTGRTTLNEAGDRLTGSYDYWALCPAAAGFRWRNVGAFVPSGAEGGGLLSTRDCPG
jgi:branched-chain amino acid transport system substrate-binding protein